MTNEDAREYVSTLTEQERYVLGICSKQKSFGYSRIANLLGVADQAVRAAGHTLTGMNLASVEPVRLGNEYNGSAIFLNYRGMQVKAALPRKYISERNAQD